jgi:hypothetical protein
VQADEKPWLPAVLSSCLALALYAVTLGGTYVYDDFDILFSDPRISHPGQWNRFFTESYNGGVDNLYRPLTSLSYALQWQIHGDKAWAFHLVNVLLHAAVAALTSELARRLAGWRAGPVAGLLFASLPVHVEAVANVVGRAELLCALGAVAALLLFARRRMTIARAVLITCCFVISVLGKEQGMLVPLFLLLLAVCTRFSPDHDEPMIRPINQDPRPLEYVSPPLAQSDRATRNARLILALLLCWCLAGYIVLRENILKFWWDRSFLDPTIQPMILSRDVDRWLLPFSLLGRYAQLTVLPLHLSPDYGGNVIGSRIRWNDPFFYAGLITAALWVIAVLIAWRRRRGLILFALLGLAASWLLVSNSLILIGTNFGERLMYLPSVFVVLLAAFAARSLRKPLLCVLLTVMVVCASVKTVVYARQWNDRLNFYRTSSAQQPGSIRLRMLLASELMSRHQLDEAADVAAGARAEMPAYDEVWIQSAVIALARDRLPEADAFLDRALQLKPSLKAAGWKERVAQRRAATRPTQ